MWQCEIRMNRRFHYSLPNWFEAPCKKQKLAGKNMDSRWFSTFKICWFTSTEGLRVSTTRLFKLLRVSWLKMGSYSRPVKPSLFHFVFIDYYFNLYFIKGTNESDTKAELSCFVFSKLRRSFVLAVFVQYM